MKTTVRANAPERRLPAGSSYLLQHLDNEDELLVLIKAAEARLLSCLHCGHPKPSIRYEFRPEMEEPHRFYAWCSGNEVGDSFPCGCFMRTFDYCAEDNIEAIEYALHAVVFKWNQRNERIWRGAERQP